MTIAETRPRCPNCFRGAGLIAASAIAFCVLSGRAWAAGVIVDSAGFESPTFSLGALGGQHSWLNVSGGTGTANVEASVFAPGGTQAVQVNRAANSDDYWTRHLPVVTPQRYITIDWDMRVTQTAGDPLLQVGPYFGVKSFDDHVNYLNPLELGGLGVEATFGKVFYDTSAGYVSTGTIATFNQWHHFRIVLDYSSMNYQAFYDNMHLVTTPFTDLNFGVNAFTDADITTTVAGNDAISAGLTGTAYFDNFVVRQDVVLLGDYDLNGIVDANDYIVWKQSFGNTVATAGSGADGNSNGKVDAADYAIWRDHLGASLLSGSGSGSLSASAAPEPSAVLLVLCGMFTVGCHRIRYVRAAA